MSQLEPAIRVDVSWLSPTRSDSILTRLNLFQSCFEADLSPFWSSLFLVTISPYCSCSRAFLQEFQPSVVKNCLKLLQNLCLSVNYSHPLVISWLDLIFNCSFLVNSSGCAFICRLSFITSDVYWSHLTVAKHHYLGLHFLAYRDRVC